MKHEKISIKWKIFLYLLVFVGILLVLLWLIQICYLDTLYKGIRTRETEKFTSEVISVLQSDSANIQEQIDALAAQKNMIVYVGDVEGNVIYSAEYIPNSRLDSMSKEALLRFYEQPKKRWDSRAVSAKYSQIWRGMICLQRKRIRWEKAIRQTWICRLGSCRTMGRSGHRA